MKLGKIAIGLIFLMGLFFIISCNSDLIITKNVTITGDWNKNDTIQFDFEINDSLVVNDFYINIRHSISYPYRNLYFFVSTEFPNGRITVDTIECILADVRGKWYGNGLGDVKENKILIRQNLQFPQCGRYQIDFVHAMRDDDLPGLSDVGIQISKSSTYQEYKQ